MNYTVQGMTIHVPMLAEDNSGIWDGAFRLVLEASNLLHFVDTDVARPAAVYAPDGTETADSAKDRKTWSLQRRYVHNIIVTTVSNMDDSLTASGYSAMSNDPHQSYLSVKSALQGMACQVYSQVISLALRDFPTPSGYILEFQRLCRKLSTTDFALPGEAQFALLSRQLSGLFPVVMQEHTVKMRAGTLQMAEVIRQLTELSRGDSTATKMMAEPSKNNKTNNSTSR